MSEVLSKSLEERIEEILKDVGYEGAQISYFALKRLEREFPDAGEEIEAAFVRRKIIFFTYYKENIANRLLKYGEEIPHIRSTFHMYELFDMVSSNNEYACRRINKAIQEASEMIVGECKLVAGHRDENIEWLQHHIALIQHSTDPEMQKKLYAPIKAIIEATGLPEFMALLK